MHISDILMYGHLTVQRTVETFPAAEVGTAGACGYWSVKDLVAHLGSYELVLVDILDGFINPGSPTPHLEAFIRPDYNFNDEQVNQRQGMTFAEVYAEYQAAHAQVRDLAAQIPADLWQQSGALPWYGAAYDLEDFIVYTYYGHKREHCGQIATFSDRFKGRPQ